MGYKIGEKKEGKISLFLFVVLEASILVVRVGRAVVGLITSVLFLRRRFGGTAHLDQDGVFTDFYDIAQINEHSGTEKSPTARDYDAQNLPLGKGEHDIADPTQFSAVF